MLKKEVYCISPPKVQITYPDQSNQHHHTHTSNSTRPQLGKRLSSATTRKHQPPHLLLRIYGTHASEIVDRGSELALLKRLAQKNIGPRILGIFRNGRFEKFLHAETLTKEDIRVPDISTAIARRMRELHDGVELELHERQQGPQIWVNFRKWSEDAKIVLDKLDKINFSSGNNMPRSTDSVLHAQWDMFVKAVKVYRNWLEREEGDAEAIARSLIFAHNDVNIFAA